jgi:hypothetical protein
MSKRRSVIAAVETRLAGIRVASGYNTDAGENVYLGEAPAMGPDDPDAVLAVVLGDEELGHQGENVVVTLPIDVQAIVKVSREGPYVVLEAMVEDIKRAMEQADRTLGGLLIARGLTRGPVRSLKREEGSEFVGAAVEYRAVFGEKWGAP